MQCFWFLPSYLTMPLVILSTFMIYKNQPKASIWDIEEGYRTSNSKFIDMRQFQKVFLHVVSRKLPFSLFQKGNKTFASSRNGRAPKRKEVHSKELFTPFQTSCRSSGLEKTAHLIARSCSRSPGILSHFGNPQAGYKWVTQELPDEVYWNTSARRLQSTLNFWYNSWLSSRELWQRYRFYRTKTTMLAKTVLFSIVFRMFLSVLFSDTCLYARRNTGRLETMYQIATN